LRGNSGLGVSTSLHCPSLSNGDLSVNKLVKNLDNGLFITNLEGLNAGINQISGDFSLSAKGFVIEKGGANQVFLPFFMEPAV
jgi:PmbA protein